MALTEWLAIPAEVFIVGGKPRDSAEGALGAISAALRADPNLGPKDLEPLEDIVRVAYTRFRRSPE
jgi:hypothetical protein